MWGAILGSALGGLFQGLGARSAANAQARAAEEAAARRAQAAEDAFGYQQRGYRRAGQAQVRGARQVMRELQRASRRAGRAEMAAADDRLALYQPGVESGQNALAALNYEMGLGDAPAGYGGFEASPGYQFRLDEGLDAVMGQGAAAGMSLSGASARALNDYAQGQASQEYGNYFGRLSGMADRGMAANAGAAAALGARGNALSGMYQGIGAARAGGAAGVADARAGQAMGIGTAGANSAYYAGDADADGIIGAGNAQAAGAVGFGNAMNDMIGNAIGLWQMNQAPQPYGYPPTTAAPPPASGFNWNSASIW